VIGGPATAQKNNQKVIRATQETASFHSFDRH
jgi:hypothetical protein